MTKLMQPRLTLLDSARSETRSLSNKLKYDFLDRLEDGSPQIAVSEEKKNRPAAGGLNVLCMASWNTWKSRSHNNCELQPCISSRNGGRSSRATSSKPSSDHVVSTSSYARNGLICPRKGESDVGSDLLRRPSLRRRRRWDCARGSHRVFQSERGRHEGRGLFRKPGYVGAIAFSRTGDPATGNFSDAHVIRKFGDLREDLSAL